MLYFYSQIGINLKFVTSNNPLSVIFISGITGNDKNDNVKHHLFLVLILKLSLLRLGKFIFLDKSFCKFKLLVLSKSLLFCITNLPFL